MKSFAWFVTFLMIFLWSVVADAETARLFGTVRDAVDGRPLDAVEIVTSQESGVTAPDGSFELDSDACELIVRKPGYLARSVAVDFPLHLTLQPIRPKALYLSYWAAGSRDLREQLLQLLDQTGMNALVIDLKSVRGDIAFRSRSALAARIGAQQARTLKDLPEFMAELKRQGIYVIGRIVVFKDDALATARHDLAALTLDGYLWEDRDKISWSDPFNEEVWDYNIDLAEEAARLGVNEIQFDYVRFPARSDLVFSKENTGTNRVAAVNGFLRRAKTRLEQYPVMVAANIFGYTCWKHKDQKIGQRLTDLSEYVDYLSPMLYPSGFSHGIPGYENPVAHPHEVILHSLRKAEELTGLPAVRFRPWLQAFRDYAYDRRSFHAADIHAQINASELNGSHGWMLWNAASRFSLAGLQQNVPLGKLSLLDAAPRAEDEAILTRYEERDFLYPPL